MRKKLIFLLIICLIFVSKVDAKEYEDTKLILDDNVVIDTDIDNSSLIMGNSVEIDNKINGVGIVLGYDVLLNSNMEHLATIGNSVTFNGKVTDAVILANKVVLNESSTVGRDITIFANSVNISGSFNRNITVHAKDVTIKDAQIAGNVKINAEKINIETNAAIIGHLNHNNDAEIKISDIASIGAIDTFVNDKKDADNFSDKIKSQVIGMINILVIFALLATFAPKLFTKFDEKRKDIIKNIGIGFIFLIILPLIMLMLIITVFGLSLGIILIALYVLLVYLSNMVTGYIIGSFIWDKLVKKEKRTYLVGVLGIIILYILKIVPYVNIVITFVSIMIGVGTIISLYNRKKV